VAPRRNPWLELKRWLDRVLLIPFSEDDVDTSEMPQTCVVQLITQRRWLGGGSRWAGSAE
jgi:hypothetical protein